MKKEITGIFQLKHDLFRRDFMNARVQYDHLSTDVASKYWERYVKNSHDFDTLVSAARKLKAQEHYSFPVNNFCIYIPETLSEEDIFKCELLISILKILENYFFELFHILFKCLDDLAIDVIEEIITEEFTKRPGNIFTTLDESELLISINKIITRKESLHTRIPFIEDIISLCLKKAMYRQRLQPHRNSYKTSKPKINHAFISVNDHDYLDLQNFLEKMEREGFVNMTPEKTVFIFLVDEILSMPYLTYRGTLNEFEKGISLDDYYILMKKREIFDLPYHKNLIAKLFKSNVLY